MNEINHFTTGQIAKYCGVNYQTVIRWIKKGDLKAFQLPGRGDRRVLLGDFLDFLSRHNLPVPNELREKKPNVLIVDDEESAINAIRRVLRKSDFEIFIASNGFEAGCLLESTIPNLLILDLKMPGMNGYQVIRRVRNSEHLKNLKILVVSGLSEEELEQALKEGANDFLAKPFDNQVLLEKVNTLLAKVENRVI